MSTRRGPPICKGCDTMQSGNLPGTAPATGLKLLHPYSCLAYTPNIATGHAQGPHGKGAHAPSHIPLP
jgi:hypothetical protein